jgi:hypothetical protein
MPWPEAGQQGRTVPAGPPARLTAATPDLSAIAGSLGIPAVVLAAYRNAARLAPIVEPGCRVDWAALAGIGKVESQHGLHHGADTVIDQQGNVASRIIGPPLDGTGGVARIADTDQGRWDDDRTWDRAVGPMQFIPTSWRLHGRDGNNDGVSDPHNVFDATLAAVAHLCRSGRNDLMVDANLERALFGYNRSEAYVATVMGWIARYRSASPGDVPRVAGDPEGWPSQVATRNPFGPPSGDGLRLSLAEVLGSAAARHGAGPGATSTTPNSPAPTRDVAGVRAPDTSSGPTAPRAARTPSSVDEPSTAPPDEPSRVDADDSRGKATAPEPDQAPATEPPPSQSPASAPPTEAGSQGEAPEPVDDGSSPTASPPLSAEDATGGDAATPPANADDTPSAPADDGPSPDATPSPSPGSEEAQSTPAPDGSTDEPTGDGVESSEHPVDGGADPATDAVDDPSAAGDTAGAATAGEEGAASASSGDGATEPESGGEPGSGTDQRVGATTDEVADDGSAESSPDASGSAAAEDAAVEEPPVEEEPVPVAPVAPAEDAAVEEPSTEEEPPDEPLPSDDAAAAPTEAAAASDVSWTPGERGSVHASRNPPRCEPDAPGVLLARDGDDATLDAVAPARADQPTAERNDGDVWTASPDGCVDGLPTDETPGDVRVAWEAGAALLASGSLP